MKNTIIGTYCLRHCHQGTPTRAVHAEGGAVPIITKVITEITDSRNRKHRPPLIPHCIIRRADMKIQPYY